MRNVTTRSGRRRSARRLSPDGGPRTCSTTQRNVVRVSTPAGGGWQQAGTCAAPAARPIAARRNNGCPGGVGFCNHPAARPCTQDVDCGSNGPCILSNDCVPLLLGPAVSTDHRQVRDGASGRRRLQVGADCQPERSRQHRGRSLLPELLDGRSSSSTHRRPRRERADARSRHLSQAAPLFNQPRMFCSNNLARRASITASAATVQPCTLHGETTARRARS